MFNTHNTKKTIENAPADKIPLWIVFLPLSTLVVMVMIMVRWVKMGLSGFHKQWIITMSALMFSVFPFMFVICTAWILLILYVQNTVLSIIGAYIYFSAPALVLREVEWKRLQKALAAAEAEELRLSMNNYREYMRKAGKVG